MLQPLDSHCTKNEITNLRRITAREASTSATICQDADLGSESGLTALAEIVTGVAPDALVALQALSQLLRWTFCKGWENTVQCVQTGATGLQHSLH